MIGSTFITVLAALGTAQALPSLNKRSENTTSLTFFNGTCTADNVIVRKEWRNLSDEEKQAFINAEYDSALTSRDET